MNLATMPLLAELFNATTERSPFGLIPVRLNSPSSSAGSLSPLPDGSEGLVNFVQLLEEVSLTSQPFSTKQVPGDVATGDEGVSASDLSLIAGSVDRAGVESNSVDENDRSAPAVADDVPAFGRAASLLAQRRSTAQKSMISPEEFAASPIDHGIQTVDLLTPQVIGDVVPSASDSGFPVSSEKPRSSPNESIGTSASVSIATPMMTGLSAPEEPGELQFTAGKANRDSDVGDVEPLFPVHQTNSTRSFLSPRSILQGGREQGHKESVIVEPKESAVAGLDAQTIAVQDSSERTSPQVSETVPVASPSEFSEAAGDDHKVIEQLERLIAGQRSKIESLHVELGRSADVENRTFDLNRVHRSDESGGAIAHFVAGNESHPRATPAVVKDRPVPELSPRTELLTAREPQMESRDVAGPARGASLGQSKFSFEHGSAPREVPVASRFSRQQFFREVASAQEISDAVSLSESERDTNGIVRSTMEQGGDADFLVEWEGVSGEVQPRSADVNGDHFALEHLMNNSDGPRARFPISQRAVPQGAVSSKEEREPVKTETVPKPSVRQNPPPVKQPAPLSRGVASQVSTHGNVKTLEISHVDGVGGEGTIPATSSLATFAEGISSLRQTIGEEPAPRITEGRNRITNQPRLNSFGEAMPISGTSHEILASSDAQAVDQVTRIIEAESQLLSQRETHHFEIRISDPDLGAMSIEIRRSPSTDGMNIRVTTDSEEVHSFLEQQAEELTRSLHEQGLNLAQFDFSHERQDSGTSPDQVVELFEEFEKARLINESKRGLQSDPAEQRSMRNGFSFRA